jgi:hypothetical protein
MKLAVCFIRRLWRKQFLHACFIAIIFKNDNLITALSAT